VLGAIAASLAFGDAVGFDLLRDNRGDLVAWRDGNYTLTALAYMAAYAGLAAFSVPGSFVMTVAGGFLFGLVPGTLMALVGGTAGATAIFLAARTGLGEAMRARWLAARSDGMFARVERGLKADELSYLLLLRLVPAVPFPIANVAPAFFGVSTGASRRPPSSASRPAPRSPPGSASASAGCSTGAARRTSGCCASRRSSGRWRGRSCSRAADPAAPVAGAAPARQAPGRRPVVRVALDCLSCAGAPGTAVRTPS
jgi:hypothetical protein